MYYDLIETPISGKVFELGGPNRIPSSDLSVAAWFKDIPFGYTRSFDVDGYPVFIANAPLDVDGMPNVNSPQAELLVRDGNGNVYPFYLTTLDPTLQMYLPDVTKIQTTALLTGSKLVTTITNDLIHQVVELYNNKYLLGFDNIHNMQSSVHLDPAVYTYVPFCITAWEWSRRLWRDIRTWGLSLTTIPTEVEIKTQLKLTTSADVELQGFLDSLTTFWN